MNARPFFWFLELPPGDVCPREKTSEEPSGGESPRGGNLRVGEERAKRQSMERSL